MELFQDNQSMELVLSKKPVSSYQNLLEAQRDLFQAQISKLQNIVATQCKLTGVNPLSQEMAAGALSIKIGKPPRDLLNPKAIKYMQFVFSIKDNVSKREVREISTQFGVTATQVREFFTAQRSRVRHFIRLSGEKARISNMNDKMHDRTHSTSQPDVAAEPIPIDTIAPIRHEEGRTQAMQPDVLLGKEKSDKHFMDSIFYLMKSEESFSGQVKLLEWILQMENYSVLQWFLAEGAVMILATWLSEAAMEEQTTVLHVILKVLCHLPLRKALPVHMSAILQSVNRLRFYRSTDISSKARILLSSWSKMFANSQNANKGNSIKSVGDAQEEMLLKQSINEVMGQDNLASNVDHSDAAPKFLTGNPDKLRKFESPQCVKCLPAPGEESGKRRGVFPSQMRERRKVKMVEPPGQRGSANSTHIAKLTPATQSRPLSADDIQKAKLRAQFMQSKYGKNDDNTHMKFESQHKSNSSQFSLAQSVPQSVPQGHDGPKEIDNFPFKVPKARETAQRNVQETGEPNMQETAHPVEKETAQPDLQETQPSVKETILPNVQETAKPYAQETGQPYSQETGQVPSEEPPWKKYKRIQNTWKMPPEVEIRTSWLVGTGESSKEAEVQKNRIRREKEMIYRTIKEIPSNPREPWECEMDYDDTLTPEIPIEQVPDVEPLETMQVSFDDSKENVVASTTKNGAGESVPEPDLELLAELLKKPEIVFALTSGQAGDLSSNETVKLLDMIKVNGITSLSTLTGLGGQVDAKVEVSLPSPTPSSDLVPNGMKRDFSRNPFSRQHAVANGSEYQAPLSVQPHVPVSPVLATHSQQVSSSIMQLQPPVNPNMHHQSYNAQHLAPEMMLNTNYVGNSPILLGTENLGKIINTPKASLGMPPARILAAPASSSPVPPTQKPAVSRSLRARPGHESINYYQNNSIQKNYNVYSGGAAQGAVAVGASWEREVEEYPKFESWSPDNSPSRPYEHSSARNNTEQRMNLRHEPVYEREKWMQRNPVQNSGFRGQGTRGAGKTTRPWDHRRLS